MSSAETPYVKPEEEFHTSKLKLRSGTSAYIGLGDAGLSFKRTGEERKLFIQTGEGTRLLTPTELLEGEIDSVRLSVTEQISDLKDDTGDTHIRSLLDSLGSKEDACVEPIMEDLDLNEIYFLVNDRFRALIRSELTRGGECHVTVSSTPWTRAMCLTSIGARLLDIKKSKIVHGADQIMAEETYQLLGEVGGGREALKKAIDVLRMMHTEELLSDYSRVRKRPRTKRR